MECDNMYKLVVRDNFNTREYDIEKNKGITKLAMEYGRCYDKVTLYNRYGKPVSSAIWDNCKMSYVKVNV